MKLLLNIALGLIATTSLCFAQNKQKLNTQPKQNLEIYPKAKEGFQRFVIQLPAQKNEEGYKVEIIVGKMMKVDCNQHGMIGSFEEKDLKGWGYTYFEYTSKGEMRSTLMGCPDKVLRDKFISNTELTRYNSKLPIVVYAPKGFQVRYKIWERSQKEQNAVIK
ncbi:serine protease inhibitor ecotin [Pedobacter cryoconitis]|uniref:Ecotin n=1 Tax=Pedobacter cryoconitis TaxID=188932 RepID=A0A7X0JAR5_9SPHI|nr:serine protease inhibitor ecotin [Pedobacter cryoconitis]MBB6502961.1 ecotin [Pedobacter cryoconitis]